MERPRIAIIGARGLSNYGGFETQVGELAPRLANLGYEVFCSHELPGKSHRKQEEYAGVRLLFFPIRIPVGHYTLRKWLELIYDWYFALKCSLSIKCDVLYFLGTGVGPALLFPKIIGKKTAVNIDGIEWRRSKFTRIEGSLLKLLFAMSYALSNCIVIDNKKLITHIPTRYREKSVFVPNGVGRIERRQWSIDAIPPHLKPYLIDVKQDHYWLVVARLEPENNIHTIIEGYMSSQSKNPLVIVGDFTSIRYRAILNNLLAKKIDDKRVIMVGSIYEKNTLDMIRCHCMAYIHGHSVGGTNPSLLEAMSAGSIVIAHDNPFNNEVSGETAMYFSDPDDLASCLNKIEQNTEELSWMKRETQNRAAEEYNWERVVDLCNNMIQKTIRL